MNDKVYTIDEIKDIIKPIMQKYNVEEAYLFGSYARGEATPDSDIDFIIDFDEEATLLTLADVMTELEAAFGKEIDIVSHNSAPASFMFNILDEEILMYA